ncbi:MULTISPECIES: bifunctional phosphoribosylaminoimidazolecarboxamide formyltransferase/IMP cyclohydrolase [unclassified Streptomyces]|uniref:bifunctional phosphoribosylaminoimidazolecarboxamide formyltransferase/IMP cyclohydrolase n=1 Tax=unclassified Streptomyces TaxID=2593676 RepID=UPI000891960B|nr:MULTISPECIES: bifunctional phosphoribosylaminoimidazolecarboxamide formyltransferase/IMP cyclohydrolase [unclassified Streptomyces]PBC84510.1 IMP cyclohydrolase /phosphoribosylaminoimidazolecarboxamide formyltransferase [Streptomyces sp. 2321.6]SDR29775.1 phosphoribosylaminoimidazolecarboxamide formyltransferase / IMP cyclohydrolase [Streptomyces sp. KS_16]SED33995.1 IMP cyclohydrolase /phosphoribosylaminoimidazolecarboxamide formyltransferase [Streptomyces sp. 2133.1]SNC70593.1 phosphoribos
MTATEGTRRPIRRALVSVYDKSGLEELAQGLHAAGVQLVSTGSTAAKIAAAGVPVTKVEELTGFPECLDGRVKTLHPKVHAGILADLRLEDHRRQLADLGVEPFDLVIVNLYPFRETVASGATPDECVEQIDIGGPSMVRAAAKNHPSVAVVVNPARYGDVLEAVAGGGFELAQRKRLAAEAFQHTAAYDVAVASWFADGYAPADDSAFPEFLGATYARKNVLRYGENPHQGAALYVDGSGGLAEAEQLHGKEMSYNNYTDTDAARRAAYDHTEPCVAIIKHANPCGIAVAADVAEAHRNAHACDPLSAFGGVIAVNRPVSVAMAEQVAEIFTEVIVAPGYEDGAVEILARKKNIRVLRCPDAPSNPVEVKPVDGGALLQETDRLQAEGDDPAHWTLASGTALSADELAELAFAWRACRAVKSNAILLAKDGATVGVGMGQVNRVDSAKLAVQRAGEDRARGSYAASDAFFPFPDGFEVLAEAGVKAVAQPGGSVRDELVVEAAAKAGVTMYFTGTRHFFH